MITSWQTFPWFLGAIAILWATPFFPQARRPALWVLAGVLVLGIFLAGFWLNLGRPPMRTLGETRLWFGLLLPLSGLLVYRWVPWRWPLLYSAVVAFLFLLFTALRPETHDRTLMPALQSPWFIPHVVLYLVGYAFLVYAAAVSILGCWKGRADDFSAGRYLGLAEVGLWVGFAFLTLGLLVGAIWAKEAWGHYWTWDPKETWAFLTWAVYLVYFHLRRDLGGRPRQAMGYLALASVVVFLTWFGVNYLPSASQSVHTY